MRLTYAGQQQNRQDHYMRIKDRLKELEEGQVAEYGHVRVECLGVGTRGQGRYMVHHDGRRQAMGVYSAAAYAASMECVETL